MYPSAVAVYSTLACLMLRGVRKRPAFKEEEMRRHSTGLLLILLFAGFVAAQDSRTVAPPEPIVEDGAPPVSAALADAAGRYSEQRYAFPTDWHPQRRECVIGTRFVNAF